MIIHLYAEFVNANRPISSENHIKNRPYNGGGFMQHASRVQRHAASFFFIGKKIATSEHTSSRAG